MADNNGGVSTLYNGNTGAIVPLVVNIPPLDANGNGTGTPTGVVASGAAGFMLQANGKKVPSVFTNGKLLQRLELRVKIEVHLLLH